MSSESYFVKYRMFFRIFISWNIKNFFSRIITNFSGVSGSGNIRKAFSSQNTRNFLILQQESCISWNIGKFFRPDFLNFLNIGLKSAPCSCILYYSPEVLYRKCVLKGFSKFTGKHLLQSFFFNRVAGLVFKLYGEGNPDIGGFMWTLQNF